MDRRWLRNRDLAVDEKRCSRCQKVYPLTDFWKDSHAAGGHVPYCKRCKNRKTLAKAARKHRLSKLFGLTPEEYDEKLANQGGKCAICGREEFGVSGIHRTPRRMAVDHNHSTGQVRGLLCHQCNSALGLFQEDPVLLDKAKEYLATWTVV